MRRVAAHFVYPVSSPPVKNGIVELDDTGRVNRIIDPGDKIRELSRMEFHNGVLVPGFVNAHSHLELSCLKGSIPEGIGLPGFLRKVRALRPAFPDESAREVIREADLEMRRNGIVACADVSNTGVGFPVKSQSPIHYHNLIEVFGFTRGQIRRQYQEGLRLMKEAGDRYDLPAVLVPHAFYSADERLIRNIMPHLEGENALLSLHHREASPSREFMIRLAARIRQMLKEPSVELRYWQPAGLEHLHRLLQSFDKEVGLMLVHNVWASGRDIAYAKSHFSRLTWVFCPRSNEYVFRQLPDVQPFLELGATIALGTDSPASNNGLSILEEMKILQERDPRIRFGDMLRWATLNGAKALGLDGVAGSLAAGLRPGLNLIQPFDFKSLKLMPESRVFPV